MEEGAEDSMSMAASELKKKMDSESSTVTDSAPLDGTAVVVGTWQKRGYSSFTRAVTCISPKTGKKIDIQIMNIR